jgi:prolyl oligopeptidase
MNNRAVAPILLAVFLLPPASYGAEDAPPKYPETRTIDHSDDYHGTVVADPYRWLETDVRESADVANWVERQNEVTFSYLEKIPEREAVRFVRAGIARCRAGRFAGPECVV